MSVVHFATRQTMRIGASLGLALLVPGCGAGADPAPHPDDLTHPHSMNYTGSGLNGMYPPDGLGQDDSWTGMFGSFLPCVAHGEAPIEITGVDWESAEATGLIPIGGVEVGV